jgi:hypothetical protein
MTGNLIAESRNLNKSYADSNDTTAMGPPKPAASAKLRKIGRLVIIALSSTRWAGSGFRKFTFGGTIPSRCIRQLSATETIPAAPRL